VSNDDELLDAIPVTPTPPVSERGSVRQSASSPPTELRGRILVEATKSFAERGFAGTSMREVAEASRCTKPALYYHFKNKEGLFLSVIQAETSAVTEILEESTRVPGSARQRIAMGIRAFFEHLRQYPEGMAVLFRAELEADEGQPAVDYRGIRELHIGMCESVVEEGVRRGEIKGDIDLRDVVLALVGMVDFRCRLYVSDQVPIPDQAVERMISIFFDGVGS